MKNTLLPIFLSGAAVAPLHGQLIGTETFTYADGNIANLNGGTAFDFIGGGKAQAIYADEYNVWVFDDMGEALMNTPHLSGTIIEYPVVADIDNDGSSEILVVSNTLLHGGMVPFTVQAVRDIEDRWVQGRRKRMCLRGARSCSGSTRSGTWSGRV